MKKLLISITIVLLFVRLNASSLDTLKKPNLRFNSALEKSKFENYLSKNQFDTIGFLLALDSSKTKTDVLNVQNALKEFYQFVDTEGDKKKKNNKKFIDFLFTNIHARFLKKYDLNVGFERIFKDGVYNCVTASALYALVFEHYGIRYQLKETPDHVYVVADPNELSILIETTDPKGGYFAPSDKFKKSYVNQLIDAKLVTASEVSTQGVQSVFDKNFYNDKDANITIKELVGLLYFNKSVDQNENKGYKSAYFELEKGQILYPSERIHHFLLVNLAAALKDFNDNVYDIESVKWYVKLFDFEEIRKVKKDIIDDFEHLADEVLIKNGKPDYFEQVYAVFDSAVGDTALKTEIRFIYLSKKAQEAYLKSKFQNCLDFAEKSIAIKPNHLQARTILVASILHKYGNRRDYENILKELDNYAIKYPFLAENETYSRGTCFALLASCARKCNADEYEQSLPYFERFEKMMSQNKLSFEEDIVGSAYGEASSYCIRKLIDYEKGREWLVKGMKYDADSEILKRKMKTLDENPMPSKRNVYTEEIKTVELKNGRLMPPPKPKKTKN